MNENQDIQDLLSRQLLDGMFLFMFSEYALQYPNPKFFIQKIVSQYRKVAKDSFVQGMNLNPLSKLLKIPDQEIEELFSVFDKQIKSLLESIDLRIEFNGWKNAKEAGFDDKEESWIYFVRGAPKAILFQKEQPTEIPNSCK